MGLLDLFKKKEKFSIKDLDEEIIQAINWISAEFSYLKELRSNLDQTGEKTDINEEKKAFTKARHALIYVRRAERRAERKIEDIIEKLKIFVQTYPQLANLEKLEKELEISSEQLLKAFSFYTGDFKNRLTTLIIEIRRKKIYLQEGKKEKAEKVEIEIKKVVNEIEKHVDILIEWVRGLEATLKQSEQEVKKLRFKRGVIAAGALAGALSGAPGEAKAEVTKAKVIQAEAGYNVLQMVPCKFTGQNVIKFLKSYDLDMNILYSFAAANHLIEDLGGMAINELAAKLNKPLTGNFDFPKRFKEALEAFPAEAKEQARQEIKEKAVEEAVQKLGTVYTIKSGDTIEGIAKKYYGDLKFFKAILDANPGLMPTRIRAGQKIILPSLEDIEQKKIEEEAKRQATREIGGIHIVQKDETLGSISLKYYGGLKEVDDIEYANMASNPGFNKDKISIGQRIIIPSVSEIEKSRTEKKEREEITRESLPKGNLYTIKEGDTIDKIAIKYFGDKRFAKYIVRANHDLNFQKLQIGQKIIIPNFKAENKKELYGEDETILLARLIFGEMRGQGKIAKISAGYTAILRAKIGGWWGKGLGGKKGVILKKWQYSCFNSGDPNLPILMNPTAYNFKEWLDCLLLAEDLINGSVKPDLGATHYFMEYVERPDWAQGIPLFVLQTKYGKALFYYLKA